MIKYGEIISILPQHLAKERELKSRRFIKEVKLNTSIQLNYKIISPKIVSIQLRSLIINKNGFATLIFYLLAQISKIILM